MCSRLVNSYLLCHYKSCFEATAQQQLLDISSSSSDGDNTRSIFAPETKHKASCFICGPHHRENQPKTLNNDAVDPGAEFEVCVATATTSRKEGGDRKLSNFDVFLQLSCRGKEFGFGKTLGCWNICQNGHINSVLHNLKDPPKEVIHYHKPASACTPKKRVISSARLPEVKSTIAAVTSKPPKTCKSAKSKSRPGSRPSSRPTSRSSNIAMEEKEPTLDWTDPPALPIEYKFKHSRHAKQHADNYREAYTYMKLRERHLLQNKSGMVIPRARLVCVNQEESGFRGMALGAKSASTTTTADYEYNYVPKACKRVGVKWYMCQRLHETCDPRLSVNNPSPTEIAMFCKVPAVRRSSPSIPSNTNGKYGGKGTDKPYPFQLNISAENQTVRAPVKRPVRPVVTQ